MAVMVHLAHHHMMPVQRTAALMGDFFGLVVAEVTALAAGLCALTMMMLAWIACHANRGKEAFEDFAIFPRFPGTLRGRRAVRADKVCNGVPPRAAHGFMGAFDSRDRMRSGVLRMNSDRRICCVSSKSMLLECRFS